VPGGEAPDRADEAPGSVLETLSGRRIVLVVTGGVAAYKAAGLARLLVKAGAQVRTAMTEAGTRFVTPLTFEAVTGGECCVSMWDRGQFEIAHVSWARWAELAIVAPATADFMAKMAAGLAGDFASSMLLASSAPVVVCPAMNSGMLANPATQANLRVLASRPGVRVLGSPEGPLACGTSGAGRMAEPREIALEAARVMGGGSLSGLGALVTSGATAEPWDDIRILTNRSSGRMGAEIARAAWVMGAEVTLLSGPLAEDAGLPEGQAFRGLRFGDCRDLLRHMQSLAGHADLVFMSAAPADFRPSETVAGKIRKAGGVPEIALVPNPDVLKEVSRVKPPGSVWVGFAAEPGADLNASGGDLNLSGPAAGCSETQDTGGGKSRHAQKTAGPGATEPGLRTGERALDSARDKLRRKGLDFIAVNGTSAFGGDLTGISLLDSSGELVMKIPDGTPKFAAAWMLLKAAGLRLRP
jgi:phosphopantothenoylcysteine decarboxylase/phosphopantothenate--cysteine ligase